VCIFKDDTSRLEPLRDLIVNGLYLSPPNNREGIDVGFVDIRFRRIDIYGLLLTNHSVITSQSLQFLNNGIRLEVLRFLFFTKV